MYTGTLCGIPCTLIVIVASSPLLIVTQYQTELCTLVHLACVVCQRRTLQIHCSSSFIPSLCTTVECSYRECVHLTQVCSVV